MVIHIVLLRVKKRVKPAKVSAVMKAVAALKRKIPGILSFKWGAYSSPEGMNRHYTHGFCTTFKDVKSRDRYLTHPEHQKVVPKLLKVLKGGDEGALVFDFKA